VGELLPLSLPEDIRQAQAEQAAATADDQPGA
jgi:hypothetical protein